MAEHDGLVGDGAAAGRCRRRTRRGGAAALVAAVLIAGPGFVQPAAAHHRGLISIGRVNTGFVNTGFVNTGFVNTGFVNTGYQCTNLSRLAGTTLLRLGSLVIGSVEHFRARECGLSRSHLVLSPAFQQWAFQNGYQWFASAMVYAGSFAGTFVGDPFRGHNFGVVPLDLWSAPVFDGGVGCTAAMGSLVIYRGDSFQPVQHALTSVVCS